MIDIHQLERNLNVIRREEGFIGGSLRLNTISGRDRNLEAKISLKHFYIEFNINPNLDELWNNDENIQEYCRIKKTDSSIESVCRTIILHEIWHWKKEGIIHKIGCPTDMIFLARNTDAVYTALEESGFFNDIKDEEARMSYAYELAGMFDDVVVNTNLSYEGLDCGLSILYYDIGKQNRAYPPIGEAFLKLQMLIYGAKEDKNLVGLFYTGDEKQQDRIDDVVSRTVAGMGIKDMALDEVITKFRDMDSWEKLAYEFAYHMSCLIDKSKGGAGSMSFIKSDAQSADNTKSSSDSETGEDSQQEEKTDANRADGEQDEENTGIAISIDRNMSKTEEKAVAAYYYGKGAGPPKFMDHRKLLRLTYDNLAGEIPIKAKSEEDGFEMPLTPFRHEVFDKKEHEVREIDFSKPVIDFESPFNNDINFLVPTDSYTVTAPYSKKSERLPDIMWLVDCSGSMNDDTGKKVFNRYWSEDSKYHYALLGVFGSIKWLRLQEIAPYLMYNVILFSDTTRKSGWHGYHELDKSLDVFWDPEFSGTHIDMDVLKPELDTKPSVIIFMSDGYIMNWDSIKSSFKSSIDKHFVSYIQIRDKTSTGEDLKNWGKDVYCIDNKKDLNGLVVDLTKQSYSKILGL